MHNKKKGQSRMDR